MRMGVFREDGTADPAVRGPAGLTAVIPRKTRRPVLGSVLGVLGLGLVLAGLACRRGGEGTPPTLPPPETRTLTFRVVSAQTLAPVPGARVVVRRGGQPDAGPVLAEATADGEGRVAVAFPVDPWKRPHLEIEAGPRFLKRYVFWDDTADEPSPDVRTLWELRPEIGADRRATLYLNFGADRDFSGRVLARPCGDLYVYYEESARPYRSYFEEAIRRVEAAFAGDRRWYRVERPEDVPLGHVLVRVRMILDPCGASFGGTFEPPCRSDRRHETRVDICPPGQYNVGHLMHEFGHVMGLGHLPADAPCGVMAPRYCGLEDFTPFEKWAFAPRKHRPWYDVPPDASIFNPEKPLPAGQAVTPPSPGPTARPRTFVCPVPGGRR